MILGPNYSFCHTTMYPRRLKVNLAHPLQAIEVNISNYEGETASNPPEEPTVEDRWGNDLTL